MDKNLTKIAQIVYGTQKSQNNTEAFAQENACQKTQKKEVIFVFGRYFFGRFLMIFVEENATNATIMPPRQPL